MSDWGLVVIAVLAPGLSAAISYGVSVGTSKARINGLRERVDKLESTRYLTRDEYEARNKDLLFMIKTLLDKSKED